MKFKDTLMYVVLEHPFKIWKKYNIYSFVLSTPFLVLHFIIGLLLSIVFDGLGAINGAQTSDWDK